MGLFKKLLWTEDEKENEILEEILVKEKPTKEEKKKKYNAFVIVGFILAIISIFFSSIGIIPISAVVISAIGLYKVSKDKENKGKGLAIVALIIAVIYTFVYMYQYGHLGFGSRLSEEQMIKFDACYSTCPSGSIGRKYYSGSQSPTQCKATCREKYGITEEEYNEWKEKSR